ncbi:MAG TPA: bacillithiol biosynthesis deacetylase BshB1 [Solirubrobacterales bacterium]
MDPVDVLAFSPHPDDAEIGCGGALALASNRGLRVAIADLTEGERASRGSSATRDEEKEAAARSLRLCARIGVGLADGEIDRSPRARQRIVQVIRQVRPHTVLAPALNDRHPDHEMSGRLVREACFEAGLAGVGEGLRHRPRRLFHYMVHSPFEPSFVVDCSEVWVQKKTAVGSYRSQFSPQRDDPMTALSGGDFLELLEVRGRWFGAMIGASYGEPYLARGPVPLRGLPEPCEWRTRQESHSPLEYSMW